MTPERLKEIRTVMCKAADCDSITHKHEKELLEYVYDLLEDRAQRRQDIIGLERMRLAVEDRLERVLAEASSLRQGVETLRRAADKLAWCHGHSHPGDECEWLKQMRAALRETEGLLK